MTTTADLGPLRTGWSGELTAAADDATGALRAAAENFASTGHVEALAAAFRQAWVWVEIVETDGATSVSTQQVGGLPWLPVHTAPLAVDDGPPVPGSWLRLRGHEVFELLLPQLQRGTGIVLDPGTDHAAILPPIAEVMPPELVAAPEDIESRGAQ